jgi:hypothetical protein
MALVLDKLGEGETVDLRGLRDLEGLTNRHKAIACAELALKIFEQIESPYADRVRKQLAEWTPANSSGRLRRITGAV